MSVDKVYKELIKLLAIQNYPKSVLAKKLSSKKFTCEDIEKAINKAQNQHLFKEDLYINSRVRKLALKGYSKKYVEKTLSDQVTINMEQIEEIFEQEKIDEKEQLKKQIYKKISYQLDKTLSDVEKQKIKHRVMRSFSYRGHCLEDIENVLDEFLN